MKSKPNPEPRIKLRRTLRQELRHDPPIPANREVTCRFQQIMECNRELRKTRADEVRRLNRLRYHRDEAYRRLEEFFSEEDEWEDEPV